MVLCVSLHIFVSCLALLCNLLCFLFFVLFVLGCVSSASNEDIVRFRCERVMYLPRGWKIQARIKRKMGQKEAHGLAHGNLHGRAAVPESGDKEKRRRNGREVDVCVG